jgi:hypothetical protein
MGSLDRLRYYGRHWIVPAAGITAMLGLATLYAFARPVYNAVLYLMGVRAYATPFVDFEARLAAVQCLRRGIDVYLSNPCDPLLRLENYSPLWLHFGFLPGTDWTTALGWPISLMFFLSLAFLPSPKGRWGLAIMLAATLSPRVAFGIERLNVDVIMFILAVAAGVLLAGGIVMRLAGYAVMSLAGLLKFYPGALLVLSARERPKIFTTVLATCTGAAIIFIITFHRELAIVAERIPGGTPFSDLFGAVNLPRGFAIVMEQFDLPFSSTAAALMWAVLLAGLFAQVFALVHRGELERELAVRPEIETIFLAIGALLVEACFFSSQNMGYRGIFLLLTLGPLSALAATHMRPRVRRMALSTSIIIVLIMWDGALTWRSGMPASSVPQLDALVAWRNGIPTTPTGTVVAASLWIVREILWWRVVAVLAACLAVFALRSPILSGWTGRTAQLIGLQDSARHKQSA